LQQQSHQGATTPNQGALVEVEMSVRSLSQSFPPWRAALLLAALLSTLAPAVPAGAAERAAEPAAEAEGEVSYDSAWVPGPRASFYERIDVDRLAIEVRVVDGLGRPVPGLGPESFRVLLDGAPAPVESLDWIDAGEPLAAAAAAVEPAAEALVTPSTPHRVVYFFQTSLEPSHGLGHMRTLQSLRRALRELPAGTVAAVVAFDSHLKLHQDFTGDAELLVAAAERALGYTPADWPGTPARGPSLARWLDEGQARHTAHLERALEMVAWALNAERGPSTVVYVGWGIGSDSLERFRRARAALVRAGSPVMVLDVTSADFHSSGASLARLASETGGLYRSTYTLPRREVARVNRLLSGHYLLVVERPALAPRSRYPLRVELAGDVRGAWAVLAPEWVVLAPPGEGSALR
jgi:VWFA-related protein